MSGTQYAEFRKKSEQEAASNSFQLIIYLIKKVGIKIKSDVQIKLAIDRYTERFIERHGHVKVLKMNKPIPIRQIFTSVRILDPLKANSFSSIKEMEENYKKSGKRSLMVFDGSVKSGFEVANTEKFLNILGAPGAGKSTLLKRIGLEALIGPIQAKGHFQKLFQKIQDRIKDDRTRIDTDLFLKSQLVKKFADQDKKQQEIVKKQKIAIKETYVHSAIPIFIELKSLRYESLSLKALIVNEVNTCGFPEAETFVDKALAKGLLLIILDGLDEVPQVILDETIENIQRFVDRYSNNRYITSCRTAFYKTYFKKFTDVVLADFDNNQIKIFAKNWFGDKKHINQFYVAKKFLKVLFEPYNQSTLELARSPLLLTFLCLIFDNTQKFPANRSSLYRKALHILLEEWAAEKRVHNEEIYQDLHPELEIALLSEIAAPAFIENKLFFSKQELLKSIGRFMADQVQAPKTLDNSEVLDAIEIQQGLLVERANDVYSFSHLTIQEFLTSLFFYENEDRFQEIFKQKFLDRRWREFFMLHAGFGKADKSLYLMAISLQHFVKERRKLYKIINWCETFNKKDNHPIANLARRSFAMFVASSIFLVNTINSRKSLYYTYDVISLAKMCCDLDPALKSEVQLAVNILKGRIGRVAAKDLMKDTKENIFHGSKYSNDSELYYEVINSFSILRENDSTWFEIGAKDFSNVESYIYATKLLFDCKNAALILSKKSWYSICSSLLSTNESANQTTLDPGIGGIVSDVVQ